MYANNTAAVICSIVLPVVAIAIAMGIWAFLHSKKKRYVKLDE